MQKLARHSTVELTIGRYTHANINDLGSAVQQMIPLPLTRSTGEMAQPNGSSGESLVALMVAGFSDNHCKSVRTADDRPTSEALVPAQNTDSRNLCPRKTLDKDCGCLSAIDNAERQGNSASVVVSRFAETDYDLCLNSQKTCDFTRNPSHSREFWRYHRVLRVSFHKCFTRTASGSG